MPTTAKLRKLHISPRKVGLTSQLIRGLNVEKALQILQHTPTASAPYLAKLIKSAISNQSKISPTELYIKQIHTGSAGMLKRIKPAAKGTAHRIRKRMTHVTLVLDQQPNNNNK